MFSARRAHLAPRLGLAFLIGCGARGPLEVVPAATSSVLPTSAASADGGGLELGGVDAGRDATSEGTSDAPRETPPKGATPDTGAPLDASSGTMDASRDDGGIGALVSCGSCVVQTCGTQLLACVQAPECGQCLQKCFPGGALDAPCLLGCIGQSAQAKDVALCIAGSCGASCGGLLGGQP